MLCMYTYCDVTVSVSACLDTVTTVQQLGLTVSEDETEKQPQTKVFTKDDFSLVSRFDSKCDDTRHPCTARCYAAEEEKCFWDGCNN